MNNTFTPGQILYIQTEPTYFYISVMRSMQQQPIVDDPNRYEIDTCCDLCVDLYGEEMYPSTITFAGKCVGSSYDMDIEFNEVRLAYDFEKKLLLDRLVYEFKVYDPNWKKPFTDSTLYGIRDWLCCKFGVDINLLPNDSILPATIYEIANYIWEVLYKETGNYQEETVELEMVNKQEFIDKLEKWIRGNTNWHDEYDWEGRNPNYGLWDELKKYLEE